MFIIYGPKVCGTLCSLCYYHKLKNRLWAHAIYTQILYNHIRIKAEDIRSDTSVCKPQNQKCELHNFKKYILSTGSNEVCLSSYNVFSILFQKCFILTMLPSWRQWPGVCVKRLLQCVKHISDTGSHTLLLSKWSSSLKSDEQMCVCSDVHSVSHLRSWWGH